MRLTRKIYSLHSWTGLISGILLLLITLSGAMLVFSDELDTAIYPHLWKVQPQERRLTFDEIYSHVSKTFSDARFIRFRTIPTEKDRALEMSMERTINGIDEYYLLNINPYTGQILGVRAGRTSMSGHLMGWMLRFHYSLQAGKTGEVIVALLAITLFISIVTGLIVYRKFLLKAILFKIPLNWRNWRLISSNLHRIVGVWGLLFNLIIVTTGFYMMIYVFKPGFFKKEEKEIPFILKNPPSIDKLIGKVKQVYPHFIPVSVSYKRTENGDHTINGYNKDQLFLYPVYSSSISFDESGEIKQTLFIENRPLNEKAEQIMYSLHFGNYGGIPIKILYAIFGLSPSILSITGFILWWRKKSKKTLPENKRVFAK